MFLKSGSGTTLADPDASGVPHPYTETPGTASLHAVASLMSALTTQAGVMAQGGTPSWPAQSATIA